MGLPAGVRWNKFFSECRSINLFPLTVEFRSPTSYKLAWPALSFPIPQGFATSGV
jgi:hypothetical protein